MDRELRGRSSMANTIELLAEMNHAGKRVQRPPISPLPSGSTNTTEPIDTELQMESPRPTVDRMETAPLEHFTAYPEGGYQAWLVVFGAFCALTASLGLYNSTGVFEAYISRKILMEESPGSIGWIFGIYSFVTWVCGVQIGPVFDAIGPRGLILAGSICTLGSVFALSACTEYYQFILAFSILGGMGSSLLITPGMGCVAHWFFERRGLASGIAFIGGGFGGVIFPLMLQSLIPQVGWEWSVRILGLILFLLCAAGVAFCRGRIREIRSQNMPPLAWKDALPDPRIFWDGTGAMAMSTTGIFFIDLAYFIPIIYIPSYFLERQHIESEDIFSSKGAFAFQLLAIINAASCVGRYVAGDLADRFGRYNTMTVSLFLCVVSVCCLFLPDVLVANMPSVALLVLFSVLFGLVSGSNVSLTPICLGQLCETSQYGRYYASCYTMVSLGCLVSIPIAGKLLEITHTTGKKKYWAAVVFTGACYVAAFVSFLWVRVRMKGWSWRVKW